MLCSPLQPCVHESPTCLRDEPQEEPYLSIMRYLITKPLALTSPFCLSASQAQHLQTTSGTTTSPESRTRHQHVLTEAPLKPTKPKAPRKKTRKAKKCAVRDFPAPSTPSSETSSATAQRCTLSTRRKRAALAVLLHHERALRAEEAVLDAYYARHGVDVVKVESRSGKSIYLPWDRGLCAMLDPRKVEELAADGIRFWGEEAEQGS